MHILDTDEHKKFTIDPTVEPLTLVEFLNKLAFQLIFNTNLDSRVTRGGTAMEDAKNSRVNIFTLNNMK